MVRLSVTLEFWTKLLFFILLKNTDDNPDKFSKKPFKAIQVPKHVKENLLGTLNILIQKRWKFVKERKENTLSAKKATKKTAKKIRKFLD